MASTYRFKRNSKQEDPNVEPAKSSGTAQTEPTPVHDNDFFPLLFGQEEKTKVEDTSRDSKKKTDAEDLTSTDDLQATGEVSLPGAEKDKPDESLSDTRAFLPFGNEESEKKAVPDDLLKALQETTVDSQKLDEVFHLSKTSGSITEKDLDEKTALLKEIFGTGDDKKKKKKKATTPAENEILPEEIEEVFASPKTLDEALREVQNEIAIEQSDDYVAVHDSQEEKTREYGASFSVEELEEQLNNLHATQENTPIPELADEVRLPDQDNLYQDTYDELEDKQVKPMGLPEEFTSPEEYDEFSEHLRGRNYKTMCTALWSFLAFLLLFYLESATFSNLYHPAVLKPGGIYNSIIFLLVDLQLVLISGLIALPSLGAGLKGMFTGKPNRHCAPAILTVFALIHPIVLLITKTQDYPLFGCLAALFLFVDSIAGFLESKRILRSFRICARKGDKLVATEVAGESAEAEAFREQLEGDPKFYTVQKASFVDGFFKQMNENTKANRTFGVSLILSLVITVAFAAFSYWKEPNVALTANRFMTMAMMTFPLSGIFTVALPFSHLSKKAEKTECAILSTAQAENYADADVVSFTDREIFPPKNVKVTTIRTYGQTRIDKAILIAAMIFQKLGGPLSHVFKKTISDVYSEIPENFDFLEITADGLCAKIDGKDVFVGNKNYLLSYDFGYTKDTMDEPFEAKTGKIMYMVIGSELAAKFYIRYSMSKRFQKTILSLFKCGICPAVKTCDPNIDADLFRTLLQNDKIPAGIIKTCDAMKDAPALERSESGLVCTSSIANLLSAFCLCDSLKHLCRTNAVMKMLSLLVGAGVVVFLYLIENLTKISGLFAILYQLLWMIPVIIPSLSE